MAAHIYTFQRPPLLETVLGVQFNPIPRFVNTHLGAYWAALKATWPQVAEQPPVEAQLEGFGEKDLWQLPQRIQLALVAAPSLRLQMRNAAGDRMLQVQNGRFHYNWSRAAKGGQEYPRYAQLRGEFDASLAHFVAYLESEGFGEPAFNQWEVTYVNHLPRGTVWKTPDDWASLFPGLPMPRATARSVRLESFSGEWHFEIPQRRGRLHVQVRHGRRDQETEVLVLNLTARGPVSAEVPLLQGLDCGREALVRSFKELTSEAAHQYWGYVHE